MATLDAVRPGRLGRLFTRRIFTALLIEIVLVVSAYGIYWIFRNQLLHVAKTTAYDNADRLIDFEKRLGVFVEPQMQRWALGSAHWLIDFANWFYVFGYMPVILTAGVLVYSFDRQRYHRYRNILLISLFIALIVFTTFPLAPPRFMPGFVDTLKASGSLVSSPGSESFYNLYAAMPSLHFGWCFLISVMLFTCKSPVLKALGLLYPLVMFFAIVLSANHYILDAVGGLGVMGLAFLAYRLIFVFGKARLEKYLESRSQTAV